MIEAEPAVLESRAVEDAVAVALEQVKATAELMPGENVNHVQSSQSRFHQL